MGLSKKNKVGWDGTGQKKRGTQDGTGRLFRRPAELWVNIMKYTEVKDHSSHIIN